MEGRNERRDGGRGPQEAAHADARAHGKPDAHAAGWPDAERLLAERLADGPIDEPDREERVRAILPPKYEVRIRMEYDPIVEETKRYRGMAREIDGRYDRFMIRMDGDGRDEEGRNGQERNEKGQDGER